MAESLVASAIQWIGSLLIQEGCMLFEVEDQVRSLQEELELMQQHLQDADANQDRKEIYTLIKQIRKLTFEAEDVIDSYIFEVETKGNLLGDKGWLMKFACALYTAPQTYNAGKQMQSMQSNVKRITDRLIHVGLKRITKVREDLRSSTDQGRYSRQKPRTYPYDDDSEFIVGLEHDIKKLVQVLVGEGKTQVSAVSIVGMGGSGKTTLARMLYNHPYIKEYFKCCAWVYISQEWSTRHVLFEIMRKVSNPTEMSKLNANSSEEELVDELRSILDKKSYLVVLDDVWRQEALQGILPALPRNNNNNNGSKILVTTRNIEVVQFQDIQRHLYVHEPRPLNKEESWELFCKIAFNYQTDCNNESYEVLGKEMLKKCDGLPLAIVALAGILNTKRSIREWQHVNEAVRSRLMESTSTHMYGRVGEMLALSYDDLPWDLKPCFLHLGVFPEDCQIPAGMLTRMWIAEGLVTANEEMSLEDVAMQHLEELSHRFMIQVVRTDFKGAIKAVRMHDLLRELCVKKARDQCFLHITTPTNDFAANDASIMIIQSRRASLHSSTHLPTQVSNLRSLVLLTRSTLSHSAYSSKEVLDLRIICHNFKLLRLLNLWGIKTPTKTLPAQIGSLIHLRYLGIRVSNIAKLPKSLENLRNLMTLDYRNIDSVDEVKIPNILYKLMLLRNLFLPVECPWNLKELQLNSLKNLQILWGLKCDHGEWFAREIVNLSTTVKKLKVFVLTENDLEAAFSCPSLVSGMLHTFHCEWKSGVVLRVNHIFSDNQHLHKLVLVGTIQVKKLSHILPSNLLVLELKDSALKDEDPMVIAGALAHLKLLRLSNCYMGDAITCEIGSFPQLEELYLENLENLCKWRIEKKSMSRLKKLKIINCRKLRHFPRGLEFVTTLQQLEFFGVPEAFVKQAAVYGWSRERRGLPHNFDSIIEQCDTPLDMSSIHKICVQLTAGIFLNNKKMKFWVVKEEDHQYNCFMLYATGLALSTKVLIVDELDNDISGGFPVDFNFPTYDWKWTQIEERDGSLIKVAKLAAPVLVLHVGGKFNTEHLTPHVTYTISYVIMFDDLTSMEEMSMRSLLLLPDGRFQEDRHKLNDKRSNEWFKVPIGDFETKTKAIREAEFTLNCRWKEISKIGFSVKAVIIEPKLPSSFLQRKGLALN